VGKKHRANYSSVLSNPTIQWDQLSRKSDGKCSWNTATRWYMCLNTRGGGGGRGRIPKKDPRVTPLALKVFTGTDDAELRTNRFPGIWALFSPRLVDGHSGPYLPFLYGYGGGASSPWRITTEGALRIGLAAFNDLREK